MGMNAPRSILNHTSCQVSDEQQHNGYETAT